MLAGTSSDLTAMRDAIATFDVDWMRGMSVALHPLKASQPEAVAKELTTIFGAEGGPGSNLIRFIPNERLNAVLVLTSRASYLARASGWIEKLDKLASANEEQLSSIISRIDRPRNWRRCFRRSCPNRRAAHRAPIWSRPTLLPKP